jgi:flavodoxin
MKTAVVYYSYEGNCAFAAERIGSQLGADVLRLYTADEKQRSGFAKYFWGGGMVAMHRKPALKPYQFDPSAYDLIIIGAPVWAASPAPPIQTFLDAQKLTGKRIALFVCHAGGKGKALDKFKSLLAGNTIAAEADFCNPGKGGEAAEKQIDEWVRTCSANPTLGV